MDTVPPREFFYIFDRVSAVISLKGCRTPEDVRKRIKKRMKTYKRWQNEAKRKRTKIYARGSRSRLANLLKKKKDSEMDFAERTIDEAVRKPKSIVNLTLLYGRARAIQMRLKRFRKEKRLRKIK